MVANEPEMTRSTAAGRSNHEMLRLDLRYMVCRLRDSTAKIFLGMLIGGLLGFVWHTTVRPEYLASVVAAPVEPESGAASTLAAAGDLTRLIGLSPQPTVSRKDEAIATLLSRGLLYQFISDLDLVQQLTVPGPLGRLRARVGIGKVPKVSDAYERLIANVLGVDEDRRTGLIRISIRWHDPETSVAWLNELVARLNKTMQFNARARTESGMEFLRAELVKTEAVEVRQAIFRLMEVQMKAAMLANVSDDFAIRVIEVPVVPDKDRPIGFGAVAQVLVGALLGSLLVAGFILLRSFKAALLS